MAVRRMSRREFMRLQLLGATAALASACGAAAPPPATSTPAIEPTLAAGTTQPAAAPTQPAAGEPRYGGTYRIISTGFVSLDPPGAEVSADWWMAGLLLYNFLYSYDRNGDLFPDLAAEMPSVSGDGLVYTIPLRRGVKFHNGREMVADDVKFSLERSLWPETYNWGKQFMQNIVGYDEVTAGKTKDLAGVKVLDHYTVEITLKTPQAVFPAILSMTMNGIIPHQETLDAGKEWGVTKAIGTGPFRFVEWVQGQRVVLERNPDYFRKPYPYLDRVEIYLDVEPSVAMMRWENGEVEWITPPSAELPRILSDARFEKAIRKSNTLSMNRLFFDMKSDIFQDIRVRQAIAMAIDKQALVQSSAGLAFPMEGIYVPHMVQFDPNFKSNYQYDPEGAKALLAEAGYPNGIKGLKAAGYPEPMTIVQADLAAIGVEIDWQESTPETFGQYRRGEIPLGMHAWSASFPDGFDYISGWLSCASLQSEGTYNFGRYCNPEVDELMAEAEQLPIDSPVRIELYRKIQDIAVNQDCAIVPLTSSISLSLSKDYVHDDVKHFIFTFPILETAWMEK
jgi:peptide/nickel transport system substrate-binding protein